MDLHDSIISLERAHKGKSLRFLFELTRHDGLPMDVVAREEARLPGGPVVRDVVRVLGDLFGQTGSPTWSCNLDVRMLRTTDQRLDRPLTGKAARGLAGRHNALAYPGPPFLAGASAKDLVTALDWLASGYTPAGPKEGFDQWVLVPSSLHVVKVPTGTKPPEVVNALGPVLGAVFSSPST